VELSSIPAENIFPQSQGDKTLRRRVLSQEGKCLRTVTDACGHFISCIRWAPNMITDSTATTNGDTGVSGTVTPTTGPAATAIVNGTKKEDTEGGGSVKGIRCVIAMEV
jgi:platelet-activating factor acetylhydrolase IB subunit alpha